MPVELTTVAITSATFHTHGGGAPVVETLDDLAPGTLHEHAGISFTTLPRPAGALRSRFATVNDVHFGEVVAGRIGESDALGPVQRRPPGATPHPELMSRGAVAEMQASEAATGPFAAVLVKGDLSQDGTPEELGAFEACYRPAFGDRLHVVRGNHDAYRDQHDYEGDERIDVPGVVIALMDTVVPTQVGGTLSDAQIDWLDALAANATDPVVVMGHHPVWSVDGGGEMSLDRERTVALDELVARRPAIIAYTAGHTHRHLVRTLAGGVPAIEVGCVKDFPGTWAEYEVYDGGVVQVVHRISSPEALAWSEQCRGLYADFGLDYTSYALGRLEDRCLSIPLR